MVQKVNQENDPANEQPRSEYDASVFARTQGCPLGGMLFGTNRKAVFCVQEVYANALSPFGLVVWW